MKIRIVVKLFLLITLLVIVTWVCYVYPMQNSMFHHLWASQLWGLNQLHYSEFKIKLKARKLPKIDKRFIFKTVNSFLTEPKADKAGGFYDNPIIVTLLSQNGGDSIHYTLDGSIPTKQSLYYRESISIAKTTVLRFRSFKSNYFPSETVTNTFFINTDIKLPVLSLVTDPVNLWNKYSGIYVNPMERGKKWERDAHCEFFDKNLSMQLRFPAKIRINGQCTRVYRKKSFRVSYFLEYMKGCGHNIITEESPESERIIVIRSEGEGNLSWRDVLFHSLYSEVDGFISRFIPCVLFLNGKLWGFYYIREKINTEYLQRIIGEGQYKLVDESAFLDENKENISEIANFLVSHDLAQEESFKEFCELMDIDNFTDYLLFNIFAANIDWPGRNMYAFKKLDGKYRKWRWIAWDVTDSFDYIERNHSHEYGGLEHNTLESVTRKFRKSESIAGIADVKQNIFNLLIEKLFESEHFKKQFVLRFCDLINSTFSPEHVEMKLNSIIDLSREDIKEDLRRWNVAEGKYESHMVDLHDFIKKRPGVILGYFQEKFHLGEMFSIYLFNEPVNAGIIQINTIIPEEFPWRGKYFKDSVVILIAKPLKGYKFIGWIDPSWGESPTIEVKLKNNLSIGASYKKE